MTLNLMVCTNDNRVINKTPENVKTVNCSVYGDCSMFQPTLLLSYFSGIEKCNYCYIPEWNRYYFVVNSTFSNGKQIILNLHCDVLMSFKPEIEALNCYITRADKGNKYVSDGNIIISSDTFVNNFLFDSSPFVDVGRLGGAYVLNVLGGGD